MAIPIPTLNGKKQLGFWNLKDNASGQKSRSERFLFIYLFIFIELFLELFRDQNVEIKHEESFEPVTSKPLTFEPMVEDLNSLDDTNFEGVGNNLNDTLSHNAADSFVDTNDVNDTDVHQEPDLDLNFESGDPDSGKEQVVVETGLQTFDEIENKIDQDVSDDNRITGNAENGQTGVGVFEKNYSNAELKNLVLTESEKTRKLIENFLSEKKKSDSNKFLKVQPRQFQPNFGGNQFNIENLNLNPDSGRDDETEALKDFFIFLKNKKLSKNRIDRPNLVESLKNLVENFEDENQESVLPNSPMLIKLLKYELWMLFNNKNWRSDIFRLFKTVKGSGFEAGSHGRSELSNHINHLKTS